MANITLPAKVNKNLKSIRLKTLLVLAFGLNKKKGAATFNDVVKAINILLKHQGTATTLEIKGLLRSLGFWATQANVSVLAAQVARTNDIQTTYPVGRKYKVFVKK